MFRPLIVLVIGLTLVVGAGALATTQRLAGTGPAAGAIQTATSHPAGTIVRATATLVRLAPMSPMRVVVSLPDAFPVPTAASQVALLSAQPFTLGGEPEADPAEMVAAAEPTPQERTAPVVRRGAEAGAGGFTCGIEGGARRCRSSD